MDESGDPWFASIAAGTDLSSEAAHALRTDGFVVMPGPTPAARVGELARFYDQAVSQAEIEDVKVGSATTRVRDFVNRSAAFDQIYVYPPLLKACCQIMGQPFKLSTMHARTLRPRTHAQQLHVDFASDARGWPMVGFIVMVDDFTAENGATCFIPGSQGMKLPPSERGPVAVCGAAGSVIVFNGSVWHGHGANYTDAPRRSIQGAYIRRTEVSSETLPARMKPETLERIGELAKYLLDL